MNTSLSTSLPLITQPHAWKKVGEGLYLGVFMAFNPVSGSVPHVQIIDRYNQDRENLIKKYSAVVHNPFPPGL